MTAMLLSLCSLLSVDPMPLQVAQEDASQPVLGLPAQFLPEIPESFYKNLPLGVQEPPPARSAVKLEKVKKSRSTGKKNEVGSGYFMTAVEAALPVQTSGFYGQVRKHAQALIDDWYGKKEPGKLSVALPLLMNDFCSVQVDRFCDLGSGSLANYSVESYLLVWDGARIAKMSLGSMVKPGLWESMKHMLMTRKFFNPYNKTLYEGQWGKEMYRATVFHQDFMRVYSDPDGRGRFVTADVSYREAAEFLQLSSPIGKYIVKRQLDKLPAAVAPVHSPRPAPPIRAKSYKQPRFTRHSLRVSPRVSASPAGSILGSSRGGHLFEPSSFIGSFLIKAGVLDFHPSINSESWSSGSGEQERHAIRSPVGYLFEGSHPHEGVRGAIYRLTPKGPEGPLLVSSRQLIDWTVAGNRSKNSVSLYALVSSLDEEYREGDFVEPKHLVKYNYDGRVFNKEQVWSLKELGLQLNSPAEISVIDANHDGVDELLLTDGHGGDFGRTDMATVTIEGDKPEVRLLSSSNRGQFLRKQRALQKLHGFLSAGGPLVLTTVERHESKTDPFVVLVGEDGEPVNLLQGQGVLLDDLDGDGDLDILAIEGGFFEDGRLVWLEQHE